MTYARANISGRYVEALVAFASQRGLDPRSLLDAREQEAWKRYSLAREFPFIFFATLLERCADAARDDAFALAFTQALPARPSGVFNTIMTNSRTLRDGFCGLCRVCALKATALTLSYTEDTSSGTIELTFAAGYEDKKQLIAGEVAVIALRVVEQLRGQPKPSRVTFTFAQPDNMTVFKAIFGDNIDFGALSNRISYPRAELHRPLLKSRPPFTLAHTAPPNALTNPGTAIDDRVASFIRGALQRGEATETQACAALTIGRRTLQRELFATGTSFRKLLDNERRRMAEYYLTGTDLSLAAISALLGYSEQSAFSRACRCWFAKSPSEFRKEIAEVISEGGSRHSNLVQSPAGPD